MDNVILSLIIHFGILEHLHTGSLLKIQKYEDTMYSEIIQAIEDFFNEQYELISMFEYKQLYQSSMNFLIPRIIENMRIQNLVIVSENKEISITEKGMKHHELLSLIVE